MYPDQAHQQVLVSIQKSFILDRLMQHGVLSLAPLKTAEYKYVVATRTVANANQKANSAKRDRRFLVSKMKAKKKIFLPLVKYDTKIGHFTMENFLGMQPLFGICALLVLGVSCLELLGWLQRRRLKYARQRRLQPAALPSRHPVMNLKPKSRRYHPMFRFSLSQRRAPAEA